jgi:hypothetical protein
MPTFRQRPGKCRRFGTSCAQSTIDSRALHDGGVQEMPAAQAEDASFGAKLPRDRGNNHLNW